MNTIVCFNYKIRNFDSSLHWLLANRFVSVCMREMNTFLQLVYKIVLVIESY